MKRTITKTLIISMTIGWTSMAVAKVPEAIKQCNPVFEAVEHLDKAGEEPNEWLTKMYKQCIKILAEQ